MNDSILSSISNFFIELIQSFEYGYLFFGSGLDLFRYLIDIILVSILFYWTLVFIRQSRAWQLIKGILLIFLGVLLCNLMGLEMIGFIFNRLLYVFAFLFIVIFQPELRRALETVGLKTVGSVKNLFVQTDTTSRTETASLINEICTACVEMSRTYTGALILIERTTMLDELMSQENVVKFDSTVTSSVLQSIFYKGSPMHDGGLLIRDGKIVAARCHVPLSVTMHELQRFGTRHRAAVGASEMGDTVVVVVSEERGKTSIAVNGRLYEMNDSKELEDNLCYLLGVTNTISNRKGIKRFFGKRKNDKNAEIPTPDGKLPVSESMGEQVVPLNLKTAESSQKDKRASLSVLEKFGFAVISIALSITLWTYIQINSNPVVTAHYTVDIVYSEDTTPANMEVSYPVDTVDVTIVGRRNTITKITANDIYATIDYSQLTGVGVVELPVTVSSADDGVYFRVEQQIPETVSVTVYSQPSVSEAE